MFQDKKAVVSCCSGAYQEEIKNASLFTHRCFTVALEALEKKQLMKGRV